MFNPLSFIFLDFNMQIWDYSAIVLKFKSYADNIKILRLYGTSLKIWKIKKKKPTLI